MNTAVEAEPGKLYRLTRDPGTTYYKIRDPATVNRLEKRLKALSVATMKADDRFTLQHIWRVRNQGHVLAVRLHRYRTEDGSGRETRAYVAFPPDYALREVAAPPGYGPKKRGSDPELPATKEAP